MNASRLPPIDSANDWTLALAARHASGAPMLDLVESNPTRVGLSPAAGFPIVPPAEAHVPYEPDPRGSRGAREAIAAYCAARGGATGADDIVLVASTSEAIAHLFRIGDDRGGGMLVPSPGYPLFEPIARAESVRIERYALEYDGRWRLDLESVRRGLEAGARLVVIVEPNPPTASCLDPHEREALVQMCARAGAAIVSDEVFGDFAWDAAHGPLPSWLGESRVPVFVLGGLSKACGLPQMKVAWIAASGPPAERADWLRGLEWLADLFLSVNGPAMEALPGWLRAREAFQNPARARVRANLRTVRAACEREPQLEWLVGRGGWSGILRLPSRRSDEQWALALLEDGVAVHPGHFYDLEIPSCLVASLIVEETRFEDGIRRIASLLARD